MIKLYIQILFLDFLLHSFVFYSCIYTAVLCFILVFMSWSIQANLWWINLPMTIWISDGSININSTFLWMFIWIFVIIFQLLWFPFNLPWLQGRKRNLKKLGLTKFIDWNSLPPLLPFIHPTPYNKHEWVDEKHFWKQ